MTIGWPFGGTCRAPSTRPSVGSSRPRARTAAAGPLSRSADPVAGRGHLVRAGSRAGRARPGRTSPPAGRPGPAAPARPAGPAPGRGRRSGTRPSGVPTASRVPAATAGGPSPPSRSVDRDPNTAGTSSPPRTARYVRTPRSGTPSSTSSPGPTSTGPYGATPRPASRTGAGAPVSATTARAREPGREPAERDLQAGRALGVADQPVGQPQAGPVGGAGPAHPEVRVPGPAEVLHRGERSGPEHLDHAGTNLTRCRAAAAPADPGRGPRARRRCGR